MKIINVGTLTNNYLFPIKNGYVLVDTGYENYFKTFFKKLKKNNIEIKDINYIFLTHAHDDHAGFLNELLYNSNAKVILHPKALEGLHRGQNAFIGGYTSKIARLIFKMMPSKREHRFPPIESQFVDRCIVLNDANKSSLEKELSGKILETPGHTECSISLYLDNGILICGDAAIGIPGPYRVIIWIDDLDDYCSSWEKIIALNPAKIYPGHGKPFSVSDLERFLPKARETKLLPF